MEKFLKKIEESNPVKRDKIVQKISETIVDNAAILCLNFYAFTTLIPILLKWPEEFYGEVERAIVDQDMKSDLEEGKLINWCDTAQILYPLITTKDGNCLLHSVSMYIWGVEDNSLLLRRLLYCTLQADERQVFKRRYFRFMGNRNADKLLQFDSMDREQEWNSIVDSIEPRHIPSFAQPLPFLEPIHIYVMANILKRPIIVMAYPRVRTIEAVSIQDNDIVGIYLPLDIQPGQCHKYPVVLGFNYNHFTPLVTTKEDPNSPRKLSIPLQKYDLSMLPVRFLYSTEERQIMNLMANYLTLIDLVHSEPISGAKLGDKALPEDLNLIPDYFSDCERKYHTFFNGDSHLAPPLLEEYQMNRSPRGKCAIFNNEKFTNDPSNRDAIQLKDRHGSSVDRDMAEDTFTALGFIVKIHNNFTSDEMVKTLTKYSQEDHSQYDCFVCVILSHGNNGHIFGSDGKPVPIRSLTDPFKSSSCQGLSGKPKLLFIQACQGEEEQPESGTSNQDINKDAVPENKDAHPYRNSNPNESDFLIGTSTVPDFVSYRHPETGSWYIQIMCKALQDYSKHLDILDILTRVNQRVGEIKIKVDGQYYNQTPMIRSTLGKRLIFQPFF